MIRKLGWAVWALSSVAWLGACGEDQEEDPHGVLDCDDGNGLDEYVAGLSRATVEGDFVVAITDATPAPPDVDRNDWDLSVTTADGDPFEEGTVRIRPWMPLHGHGTSPERYNAVHVEADAWEVTGVNFTMPGLWEVNVEVTPVGGPTQELMFRFCAQG